MPIAETPLAQVVLEVATKCTGDPTLLPPVGEETETVQKAEATNKRMQQNTRFICTPLVFSALVFTLRNTNEKRVAQFSNLARV
jgi:hypothetical protein